MRARSVTIGCAAIAAAVVLGGCGGEAQRELSVRLTDYRLRPARAEINGPAEVRFRVRNTGSVPHALTVVGPKEEVEIEPLPPGGRTSFKIDLDEDGRFRMFCPVGDHRGRGMRGSVTVD